jgi:hypothetical protein
MESSEELRQLRPRAVDWKKYQPSSLPKQAPPAEQHLYSEEAEAILIDVAKRLRELLRREGKRWNQTEEFFERVEEEHENRVGNLRLFFFQKRTGFPF